MTRAVALLSTGLLLLVPCATSLCAATLSAMSAQGLAALARQEEERRKTVRQAGKAYTNDDLKGEIASTAPPPAPAGNATAAGPDRIVAPPSPGTATPAPTGADAARVPAVNLPGGKAEEQSATNGEAYWRTRIMVVRDALDRSRIFADALQSRINALTTDVVNRDDPAQRATLELERRRALDELERVKGEVAANTEGIAKIQEEARKAGVPPGWLR